MEREVLAYWLTNCYGIGRKKIQILCDYFQDMEEIFCCEKKIFRQIPGISERDQIVLCSKRNYTFWKESLCQLEEKGIHFVWIQGQGYPMRLKQIPDPPFALYVRGGIPEDDRKAVAIVGARNASYEGIEIAGKFGRELAENGIRVISGLARGIDVAAQRGALQIPSGRTYSVLGTGIDLCYPREHIETYMQIIRQGGLLSEYAPGTKGKAGFFALRNRIISGMADGILVIEAGENSGSLITAESGLDQGKDIFVVPGGILNPSYQGSNRLIKEGASLVTQTQDILDGLGIFLKEDMSRKKKKIEDTLETPEKIVYAILGFDPIHISDIAEHTGMQITEVMDSVSNLEHRHLIHMVGHHYYALCL